MRHARRALLPCTCIYLDRSGGAEGANNVQRNLCAHLPQSHEFLFLVDFARLAPDGDMGDATQEEKYQGSQKSLPFGCRIKGINGGRGRETEVLGRAGLSGATRLARAPYAYTSTPGPFWRGGGRE